MMLIVWVFFRGDAQLDNGYNPKIRCYYGEYLYE